MSVKVRVARLIQRKGTIVTYKQTTPGAYSASTGKTAAATVVTHEIRVMIGSALSNEDETLTARGTFLVTVPATVSFTPAKTDQIVIDSVTCGVEDVNPQYEKNVVAFYELEVRRGT